MRTIDKSSAPSYLPTATNHARMVGPEDWSEGLDMDQLRQDLCRDQHGLCVYCGSRIAPRAPAHESANAAMTVEHWAARETHPELMLSWNNLFAVCPGGTIKGRKTVGALHCDKKRLSIPLRLHPSNTPALESLFEFDRLGHVSSRDERASHDIDVLGLDKAPNLIRNRKSAIRALSKELRRYESSDREAKAFLKRQLALVTARPGVELPPFSFVVRQHIIKKMKRYNMNTPSY